MNLRHLAVAALAVASCGAFAQGMKPGLWEITHKMQTGSGEMEQQMAQAQAQMANLPPEQRKMMEEMMAKQGVRMGASGPGGMTVKVCMSREMAERGEVPTQQQQGDCRTTTQPRTGNTMKMAMTTAVQGRPEKINMEGGGKWLGADCGDIKPMMPPKR